MGRDFQSVQVADMKRNYSLFSAMALGVLLFTAAFPLGPGGRGWAREKSAPISPNDPTAKLFGILDNNYDGKLTDFYILADVYKDADHPDQEWQHILRVEYDKKLFFGKFRILVRTISKPTADQLKTYSVKQMFDFGSDSAKYEKIDIGPFGQKGDLYLRAEGDMPLASAPITPEVQSTYEKYLTQYLTPALSKPKSST
jgi:hypothetical protein